MNHTDHSDHPCFSEGARHKVGRIHLPVAPKCNMQCNYCNRDFECVNESRPGVSSTILTPQQAAGYLDAVLERVHDIRVVGIAGPGDPFANGYETMETLRLVRERHSDMMLCLATNGLEVAKYVDEIARLDVSHVTVTVNAVDPAIGGQIYAWARLNGKVYRGVDAAGVICRQQSEAIRLLKVRNITVKINTVVIPGINDGHVKEIAKRMAELKADIHNCIPLYHVAGTPFEKIDPITADRMDAIRAEVKEYMPQMRHCTRCRADAAGMIGEPQSREVRELLKKASQPHVTDRRPYVAVASMEGLLVNQHLGEATSLWIFGLREGQAGLVERRSTPEPGGGTQRWREMADVLQDCSTILVSGIGPFPKIVLEQSGMQVVVMEELAKEAVDAVLTGHEIPRILLRTPGRCQMGKGCSGTGMGCG
jgi:nitrogen fixation protein NifB